MKTKKYLIQSSYGFVGSHNGRHYSIIGSGLSIWSITSDGSAEGLHKGFLDAQQGSATALEINEHMRREGVPIDLARWLLFSVVERF